MKRLEGKVVAVVGGATGIGAATVRRIVAEGGTAFLGDINIEGASQLAESVRAAGGTMEARFADQGDDDSMRSFVHAAAERFGRLDGIFLNGADINPNSREEDTDAVTLDLEVWDRVMRINLRGYMLGIRYAIPIMLKTGGGSIVCTSSEYSFTSIGTMFVYGISKAGVNQLVRHTAARFGRDGIRCNAIAPGLILSESAKQNLTPELEQDILSRTHCTRLGIPDDIAASAVHLLSDDSHYINGQVIAINGGTTFR